MIGSQIISRDEIPQVLILLGGLNPPFSQLRCADCLWVPWFPPTVQTHPLRLIANAYLPVNINVGVNGRLCVSAL